MQESCTFERVGFIGRTRLIAGRGEQYRGTINQIRQEEPVFDVLSCLENCVSISVRAFRDQVGLNGALLDLQHVGLSILTESVIVICLSKKGGICGFRFALTAPFWKQATRVSRPNHPKSVNGMESKYEVARSDTGGCYICRKDEEELYLVRNAKTGQMTALCGCCLLPRLDGYLIDNTRTWPIKCAIDRWEKKPGAPTESD